MRIIRSTETEPYHNLASEEYLLDNTTDDVFMLWRNAPSVIIGKNQNAYAEVNRTYADEHGIKVVRRLTGGGAVFHDFGNVNYTFITTAPDDPQIDFARFAAPVIEALGALGVSAELGGRNDIIADGFKISGNAQCVHNRADGTKMLLHHGTLLYDADTEVLAGVLRVNEEKMRSKGIKSVTSRVRNIRQIGGLSLTAEEFADYVLDYAAQKFGGTAEDFTPAERCAIDTLAAEKYSTWEWNFGRSPEYGITHTKRFPYGTVTADFTVDRGIIKDIKLSGDFFGTESTDAIENALRGSRYEYGTVLLALDGIRTDRIISGASAEEIAALVTETNTANI